MKFLNQQSDVAGGWCKVFVHYSKNSLNTIAVYAAALCRTDRGKRQ